VTDHASISAIQEPPRVGWSTITCGDLKFEVPPGWHALPNENYYHLNGLANVLSDLDRNEHGRHEGDVDSGDPTGVSQGNPYIEEGQQIGFTMGGQPIVMPPRAQRSDPKAWVPE